MLRWLKALPLALALAALIVFATFAASCGSNNSQARFVNAISDDKQSLDIEFNGTKVSGFGGIGPFTASGSTYVSIPTGSDKIQGLASGTTTTAFGPLTSPISFNSGSQYTVVATGLLASPVIVAPVDNNTAPAVGKVNFRVIDASLAVVGAVDVYIIPNIATGTPSCTLGNNCGAPAISGVSSPQSSTTPYSTYETVSYNSIGSYGYTMYVTPTTETTPVQGWSGGYQLPEIGSVTVGSIRTIVLVDNPGAQTMSSTPILLTDLN
jgi:Domain of unknown function (DUF4397)